MTKAKRIPRSKDELKAETDKTHRTLKQKKVARDIWPLIEGLKSIYDAQTAVNAAAGYIELELALKMTTVPVKDLMVSLKSEKKSDIKESVQKIVALLADQSADESVALLKRMGNGFGQYSALQYLKNPMSKIKVDDFIA
jgi:hypothetical protein